MAVETLRLSSHSFVTTEDGNRVQYEPRIKNLPLQFGSRISAEQPGQPGVRVTPNGGVIQFALDRTIWPWLDYHWKGREFRVYLAAPGDRHDDIDLVYTGRIEDLSHDTLTVTLQTATGEVDLDGNLIDEMYGDDAPEAIREHPKPGGYGQFRNAEPILTDLANRLYDLSTAPGWPEIDEIDALRVGGVPWTQVAGGPGASQYAIGTDRRTIHLGGETDGGEVRVDARMVGWETATHAGLIRMAVTSAGGTVNATSMLALDTTAPYRIGYYTHFNPINRLNLLDEIANSMGGFWGIGDDAAVMAGVFGAPAATASLNLSRLGIASLRQTGIVPPSWRIPVEHSRNWQPSGSFFTGVSDEDQQRWRGPGLTAPTAGISEDEDIKEVEPRAVEVPTVRSLVNTEADAQSIAARLFAAFRVPRNLYDIDVRVPVPALYDTVGVDYMMVRGNFRVHSVLRSFGGGAATIQLWGSPLTQAGEAAPTRLSSAFILTEEGEYLLTEEGERFIWG